MFSEEFFNRKGRREMRKGRSVIFAHFAVKLYF